MRILTAPSDLPKPSPENLHTMHN